MGLLFSSSSSSTANSSNKTPSTTTDTERETKMMHIRQVFRENCLYIPERYFIQMIEAGLTDQMVTIINDVNRQATTLTSSNLKRRWDETDDNDHDGDVQQYGQPKKLKQQHISIQTTTDPEPIFYDPDDPLFEDFTPGHTYFTKSFYAPD
jgi:uncharacterized protein (UPF0305 family)